MSPPPFLLCFTSVFDLPLDVFSVSRQLSIFLSRICVLSTRPFLFCLYGMYFDSQGLFKANRRSSLKRCGVLPPVMKAFFFLVRPSRRRLLFVLGASRSAAYKCMVRSSPSPQSYTVFQFAFQLSCILFSQPCPPKSSPRRSRMFYLLFAKKMLMSNITVPPSSQNEFLPFQMRTCPLQRWCNAC